MRMHSSGDAYDETLALRLAGGDARRVELCRARAAALVRQNMPEIERVAATLLERGELSGPELARALGSEIRYTTGTLTAAPEVSAKKVRDDGGRVVGEIELRSGRWWATDEHGRHLGTFSFEHAARAAVRRIAA
jgi:hypothetical protein